MVLPVPFWTFGYIYSSNGSTPSVGATVLLYGSLDSGNTTSVTGGFYQYNIQNVCNDGDTITVSGSKGANEGSDSFVLDVSDSSTQQNVTYDGVVAAAGAISFIGDGTLTFSGTGTITI